jgi:hypothetical protein
VPCAVPCRTLRLRGHGKKETPAGQDPHCTGVEATIRRSRRTERSAQERQPTKAPSRNSARRDAAQLSHGGPGGAANEGRAAQRAHAGHSRQRGRPGPAPLAHHRSRCGAANRPGSHGYPSCQTANCCACSDGGVAQGKLLQYSLLDRVTARALDRCGSPERTAAALLRTPFGYWLAGLAP